MLLNLSGRAKRWEGLCSNTALRSMHHIEQNHLDILGNMSCVHIHVYARRRKGSKILLMGCSLIEEFMLGVRCC